jgi:quercetin dioxygenase-like cupin family protein
MLAALAALAALQAPAGAARISPLVPIVDNGTVHVDRAHLTPGGGLIIPPERAPLLVIALGDGDIEVSQEGSDADGALRSNGAAAFVAKGDSLIANDGPAAADILIVEIKSRRPPAPAAPPTDAPPGITRTTMIDNADVRVVRVRFAPGSREPVHTHPNDLLTVQLTPASYDITLYDTRDTGLNPAGSVRFLPRDAPHAYINTSSIDFELLSVSIK